MISNKYQAVEHIGIIKYVTSPTGDTMVKIVSPDMFAQMEGNKLEKDYCCIVDDRCYISKKANYDTVVIYYAPNMKTMTPEIEYKIAQEAIWEDIDEIKEDQSPYAALLHIKQNYRLVKK